jgi:hypothetical protein
VNRVNAARRGTLGRAAPNKEKRIMAIQTTATEDRAWADWSRASAMAQNEYHRAWKAANDAFRAGGPYAELEAATNAALAARNAADELAAVAYRAAMAAKE